MKVDAATRSNEHSEARGSTNGKPSLRKSTPFQQTTPRELDITGLFQKQNAITQRWTAATKTMNSQITEYIEQRDRDYYSSSAQLQKLSHDLSVANDSLTRSKQSDASARSAYRVEIDNIKATAHEQIRSMKSDIRTALSEASTRAKDLQTELDRSEVTISLLEKQIEELKARHDSLSIVSSPPSEDTATMPKDVKDSPRQELPDSPKVSGTLPQLTYLC
jgi:hypothetical protein